MSEPIPSQQPKPPQPQILAPGQRSLPELAQSIREAQMQIVNSLFSALGAYISLGQRLIEAKKQVGHGNWEDWLADECRTSKTKAQRYMRLANKKPLLDQLYNHRLAKSDTKMLLFKPLSQRDALKLLSEPKRRKRRAKPTPT